MLDKVLTTLDALIENNAKIVLRLPLIPGMNDSDDDLAAISKIIREREKNIIRAEIMRYHILGSSKSKALGRSYEAPKENAQKDESERWLMYLQKHATERTVISE